MYNIYSDDVTEIVTSNDELCGEITLSALDQEELDVTGYDELGQEFELMLAREAKRRQTERKTRSRDFQ